MYKEMQPQFTKRMARSFQLHTQEEQPPMFGPGSRLWRFRGRGNRSRASHRAHCAACCIMRGTGWRPRSHSWPPFVTANSSSLKQRSLTWRSLHVPARGGCLSLCRRAPPKLANHKLITGAARCGVTQHPAACPGTLLLLLATAAHHSSSANAHSLPPPPVLPTPPAVPLAVPPAPAPPPLSSAADCTMTPAQSPTPHNAAW